MGYFTVLDVSTYEVANLYSNTPYSIIFHVVNIYEVESLEIKTLNFTTEEMQKPIKFNLNFKETLSEKDKNTFLCSFVYYIGLPTDRVIMDVIKNEYSGESVPYECNYTKVDSSKRSKNFD